MTTTTPTTPELRHPSGCKAKRIEITKYPNVTTTHCLDCGAHVAYDPAGAILPAPSVTGGMSGYVHDVPITMEAIA